MTLNKHITKINLTYILIIPYISSFVNTKLECLFDFFSCIPY